MDTRACHVLQSCLTVTPGTAARQAPLSMGFSRILQRVSMPSSRDHPYPGIEPTSLMPPALAGGSFTTRPTREAQTGMRVVD